MNRPHTLRTIAEAMGREKRTAQYWYQQAKEQHGELGELIDGTRHFSDEERALLVQFAGDRPAATPPVTIDQGNHARSVTVQIGSQETSLEQFRTTRTRQHLANPREFMTNLVSFLDQIEEGMESAEKQQEEELHQLKTLKRQSQKRVEQFRRRADEYRIKTDILTTIQNTELEELADMAEEINAMGKPAAAPSPSAG